MFTISEIKNKEIWENFVLNQKEKTFHHSWNWGEKFNLASDGNIWRLGVYEDKQLVAVFLVIKIKARRGMFLFVPQGPIFDKNFFSRGEFSFVGQFSNILVILTNYLRDLALDENCDFIRISPALENDNRYSEIFKGLGFRRAPIHMHAELMWLLDISKEEQTLLKDMRKTTRYSVHKAERDGVKIIKSSNIDDVLKLNSLYEETAKRHKFTGYSLIYLEQEFKNFIKDNQILLFLAEYKDETIAAAMIIFYGGVAYYHHGASANHPGTPAAYLLQWEVIKEAKRRGCSIYNFWGITEDANHPWAGLTLFKKGFGGFSKEYLPAQDLPLKRKYWLNFIVEKIRKARRRL